jgi:RNA polymerase sigma-70 factor, ECF subfamily
MADIHHQLEQHYTETGPMLLAYFRRQRALAAVADDLLQETFVRALRQPARFRAAISPRAYLFGIARHLSLDALRRQRFAEPLADEAAVDTPVADPRIEAMRAAIAALPETHREPLLLKLQQELSYEEIAVALDIPIGTVRSRLHHAVARLQKTLNPAATSSAAQPETP